MTTTTITQQSVELIQQSLLSIASDELLSYAIATIALLAITIVILMAYSVRLHAPRKIVSLDELRYSMKFTEDTIFPLLLPHLVSCKVMEDRGYSSLLNLAQTVIGTVPTCDMALEIWPPAFDCYNIVVPNLLNLPELIFGIGCADAKLISLALYESSRANNCAYCTSHCCSFALRRGVAYRAIANDDSQNRTPAQRVVADVAIALGRVPCTLEPYQVANLHEMLPSPSDREWIVASVAMIGAFNKLMDGLGVPLEPDTYAETVEAMHADYKLNKAGSQIGELMSSTEGGGGGKQSLSLPPPPVDDWTHKLNALYHGLKPGGAMAIDKKLLSCVPVTIEDCMTLLEEKTGTSFVGIIDKLSNIRACRAVTAVVMKNFLNTAGLGLKRKLLVAIDYTDTILRNARMKSLLEKSLAVGFGYGQDNDDKDEELLTNLVLKVGKALSKTPNQVTPNLVQEIRNTTITMTSNNRDDDEKQQMQVQQLLSAPMLVELLWFLAMVQMLHRIERYYEAESRITTPKKLK